MKKAGNNAVNVKIFESLSPHKCIKIAAIIMNFGIAMVTSMNKVVLSLNSLPTAATSIAVRNINPKKLAQYKSYFPNNK